MDGVLVDSMPYHFIAWFEALQPLGIRVSAFEVYEREGESWEKSLRDFISQGGLKPTPGLMRKVFLRRRRIFRKYFKRTIFSGAPECLGALKKMGLMLGIVTGTPMPQLKRILPGKMRSCFDTIVTGDLVEKGKPHPEPFLKAAKRLGLRPSQCLVIENAPLGIKSAKAAGMHCLAVTTSLPKAYLTEADAVVSSLKDVVEVLGCLPKINENSY
jgi:beta-phosphoglucomutase